MIKLIIKLVIEENITKYQKHLMKPVLHLFEIYPLPVCCKMCLCSLYLKQSFNCCFDDVSVTAKGITLESDCM